MRIYKEMTNNEIAELLRAVASSYQLKDDIKNRFRIIAYQRAADAVEHASSELKDLWDEGKLKDIAGIGESIAADLDEIFKTGKSKHFEEIMRNLPKAMFDLLIIPGVGAKTSYKLVKKLGISEKDPISQLEKAAQSDKIAKIEGFGKESQSDILRSIQEVKGRTKRHLLPYATSIAEEIIDWLKLDKEVIDADPLGSLRRKASTVGDIDISVSTNNAEKVLTHFINFPKKQRVLEKGDSTASIVIPGDVQVDLMTQSPDAYGALLQHFTGSKHHNIALREYAQRIGYSLSEYGIKYRKNKKLVKFSNEKDFYNFLKLDWIPPELREDTGEIEIAKDHKLPVLVSLEDIKSDLQIHSDFDIETSHDLGESSMQELIKKGNELDYEYIVFSEHNPSQKGHTEAKILDILKRKKENIEQINYSYVKSVKGSIKKVFNCLEIDILPSGKLPIPEKGLELLDFVLVSIHSGFRYQQDKMTERVLSGLSHKNVRIFAHPTARKLNTREGIELEWSRIFDFCKKYNKWIEINADPMRLDLPDILVKDAVQRGIKLTIGTDSHHKDAMDNMIYGLSVARRGWATRSDIINTNNLVQFESLLRQ